MIYNRYDTRGYIYMYKITRDKKGHNTHAVNDRTRSNASNIFLALTKRERTYQREKKNIDYMITEIYLVVLLVT